MQIDALINMRGMTSAQAAAFVGEHVETFLRKVREGRRPGPDLVFGPRQRYWLPATLIEAARRKNVGIEPPYSVGSNDGLGAVVPERAIVCSVTQFFCWTPCECLIDVLQYTHRHTNPEQANEHLPS